MPFNPYYKQMIDSISEVHTVAMRKIANDIANLQYLLNRLCIAEAFILLSDSNEEYAEFSEKVQKSHSVDFLGENI